MKDHREIGRALDLFMFSELSPGNPIWLPKGNIVYSILQNKIRNLQNFFDYQEVRTPILWKNELFRISGHWDHYRENMFHVGEIYNDIEPQLLAMKPMNCPGHMEIFRSKQWSVRDLPYRMADQGVLHRNEVSGALGGLTRCVSFCQDDSHIFCTPGQIGPEIDTLIGMVQRVYKTLGMNIRAVLSTRPNNYMGDLAVWTQAEADLKNALEVSKQVYSESPGDGAFYGPKIDFHIKDSLGREWQTATVQLDFQLPMRFKLEYMDHDGERKCPVVIHRAIYGSFERFIGILLEHYQGRLPCWLAPVQYAILPVSDKVADYAQAVLAKLKRLNIRAELDASNSRLQQKIAIAEEKKIPFIVVVGDKEKQNNTLSVRQSDGTSVIVPDLNFYAEASYNNEFDF